MNYAVADRHNILQLFVSPVKTYKTVLNFIQVSMCRDKWDKGSRVSWDVTLYHCFSIQTHFIFSATGTTPHLDLLSPSRIIRSKSPCIRVLNYLTKTVYFTTDATMQAICSQNKMAHADVYLYSTLQTKYNWRVFFSHFPYPLWPLKGLYLFLCISLFILT